MSYDRLSTKELAVLLRTTQDPEEFAHLRRMSDFQLRLPELRDALYDRIAEGLEQPARSETATTAPPISTNPADHVQQDGITYNLSEWVTMSEYASQNGIKSTNTVTNWINRAIVPPDCTIELRALNGLRLIRNQPYKIGPG